MNNLTNLVVVALGALVLGYFLLGKRADLDGAGAQQLVQDGARLVDVRTPSEFSAGHIPGAVNIPLQDLESRMAELEPKGEPIVLYCRSGNRSVQAAHILQSAGYSAVHNLGPMSAW